MSRVLFPRALAALLTVGLLSAVAVPSASAALPNLRDTYGPAIDAYPSYQAQSTCASALQPGTIQLAALLRSSYPGTNPATYLRSCSSGGVSEHKDGRAVDWMLDATDPAERRIANEFIAWITAPDRYGNPNAMARRLGIMYIIWDGALWRGWSGSQTGTWDRSRDRGHRDHIHISLGSFGAQAKTSFYTGTPWCDTSSSSCPVSRLGGSDRYATAVQVSRQIAPSSAVVIASGRQESLVDGLVSAPLAKTLSAPILLTGTYALPSSTLGELTRRAPQTAYVVGGAAVVSPDVVAHLERLGMRVVRMAGDTRYATSAAVAAEVQRLVGGSTVALASGRSANLVDALSVGASAAATGTPVLLTDRYVLPGPTQAALAEMSTSDVLAVGGQGVVSPEVVTELESMGMGVTRLGGADRYRTAVAVAEYHRAAVGVGTVVASAGLDGHLVDALPAGALGRILVLSTRTDLPAPVSSWLTGPASQAERAIVVGGESATGYGVVADLAAALR